MAYNAKAQKKYNEKTILIAASYKPNTDLADGQRVKAYLEQTGQSANSYIKALIKADLDSKEFSVDSVTTIDMKSLESNNDTNNS